jgi:putative SOS response-associated peptidase YedK
MCGRFGFTKSKDQVKKRFNLNKLPEQLALRYNISPTQNVPAILNESRDELSMIRWGLLPSWSKDEKPKINCINAKCETIAEKPLFKSLLKTKRCLILADSFYEWKKTEEGKHPYRIMLKSEDIFAFAGLWDVWEREGKRIVSCVILTTTPNDLCSEIHDRMPVILKESDEEAWLSGVDAAGYMKPYDDTLMRAYPISTLVNSPLNNNPEIVTELKQVERSMLKNRGV